VRLLTQSLLRWPDADQVLQHAQAWALEQQAIHPSLLAVELQRDLRSARFGAWGNRSPALTALLKGRSVREALICRAAAA